MSSKTHKSTSRTRPVHKISSVFEEYSDLMLENSTDFDEVEDLRSIARELSIYSQR